MGRFVYSVAPFIGTIQAQDSAAIVSQQLQLLINEYARKGWEFCSLEDGTIQVKPGCLGSILGNGTDYIKYNQVIFRRPLTDEEEAIASYD